MRHFSMFHDIDQKLSDASIEEDSVILWDRQGLCLEAKIDRQAVLRHVPCQLAYGRGQTRFMEFGWNEFSYEGSCVFQGTLERVRRFLDVIARASRG